jgi:hypothetical protein
MVKITVDGISIIEPRCSGSLAALEAERALLGLSIGFPDVLIKSRKHFEDFHACRYALSKRLPFGTANGLRAHSLSSNEIGRDEYITHQLNLNAANFVGPTLLMVTSFQMVNCYISFMKIFMLERASGQYMSLSFLLARLVVKVPFLCLQGASYGTTLSWLAGLRKTSGPICFI